MNELQTIELSLAILTIIALAWITRPWRKHAL